MSGKKHPNLYGIAEWHGELYRTLPHSERLRHEAESDKSFQCRFLTDLPDLAPINAKKAPKLECSKSGGVCSIRKFIGTEGIATDFGPITATCPNRFLEGGAILETIQKDILQSQEMLTIKEIPFLKPSTINALGTEVDIRGSKEEDVGRIDLVCVDPSTLGTKTMNWCAVELQAVYFSGAAMSKDYAVIKKHSDDTVPMPGGSRRPDFRSSGPKRLMPQLQTKVPTLRRWGKKMAVVVDRPFMEAMGPMQHIPHPSNADISWIVVDYRENLDGGQAELFVHCVIHTTLERAVEGLTAGEPTTLPDFENKVIQKLGSAHGKLI